MCYDQKIRRILRGCFSMLKILEKRRKISFFEDKNKVLGFVFRPQLKTRNSINEQIRRHRIVVGVAHLAVNNTFLSINCRRHKDIVNF